MTSQTFCDLDEIMPGDLLFFARPSFIQRFSGYVGDDFRGVAIADRRDETLTMIQCGRISGFELRTVADLVDDYDVIAVASAPQCACTNDVIDWARRRLSEPNHYPLSSLVAAFFVSWSRQPAPRTESLLRRALVFPAAVAVAVALSAIAAIRPPTTRSFICSTFTDAALGQACPDHRLMGSMTVPKPGLASKPLSAVDQLLRRWFLTPADIWRSLPPRQIRFVRLGVGTADRTRPIGGNSTTPSCE